MPRRAKGVTVAMVRGATAGRYGDGLGLFLYIPEPTRRYWTFRYRFDGRAREMGLGLAYGRAAVSLSDARAEALKLWRTVKSGVDPLAGKQAMAPVPAMTFAAVAEMYITAHRAGWRGEASEVQWRGSLGSYVFPLIGEEPVANVDTGAVMRVLEPIWLEKPETARRVRSRVELVLDYAAARTWRTGENPARWRGHIENLLPRREKVSAVRHHAAMPWRDIPAFVAQLADKDAMGALAFRFLILTAARAGEVLGAVWDEISGDLWTVPAARVKAGKVHRVPLSGAALEILRTVEPMRVASGPVFPSRRSQFSLDGTTFQKILRRMEVDATAHGFRASFRDWCGETGQDRTVAELCLAHSTGNKTEQAYARSDLLERRRALLGKWARFCTEPGTEAAIVPIRGAR
jgi:integrase